MAEKIQLKVLGVSRSANSHDFYCMLLEEIDGDKKLPIIIGRSEAQTVVVSVEKMQTVRPFLADVIADTANKFDLRLKEVFIYKKQNGIYFTQIIWQQNEKIETTEARPSDAVALALRCNAPIFIEKEIIEQFGISPSNQHEPQMIELPLSEMTKSQLNVLLQDAVEEENYERAAIIRDLLKTKI